MKKRLPKIFAILTIGLMLSSVSYAGSDASPGKATKIEIVTPVTYSYEAVNVVTVFSPAVVQKTVTVKNMISPRCEAIPVKLVVPTASRNERWRSDKANFITYNIRSGTTKAKRNIKYQDIHRLHRQV